MSILTHAQCDPEIIDMASAPAIITPDLQAEFDRLAADWRASISPTTTAQDRVTLPAYRRIIKLGQERPLPVLELILEDLRSGQPHWFVALEQITGENPAAGLDTSSDMADAWLAWGRARGLVDEDLVTPVPALGKDHPLAGTAGAFADDPGWDLMMDAIRARRIAEDQDDAA